MLTDARLLRMVRNPARGEREITQSILFVILSYAGAFIDKRSAPARVSVAILMLLIVMEKLEGVYRIIPNVNYRVWLIDFQYGCFCFNVGFFLSYVITDIGLQHDAKLRRLLRQESRKHLDSNLCWWEGGREGGREGEGEGEREANTVREAVSESAHRQTQLAAEGGLAVSSFSDRQRPNRRETSTDADGAGAGVSAYDASRCEVKAAGDPGKVVTEKEYVWVRRLARLRGCDDVMHVLFPVAFGIFLAVMLTNNHAYTGHYSQGVH